MFVLCPSYHGSTLLALLLNNHSSISALGDTNPRLFYDQSCGCGRRTRNCEFWRSVGVQLGAERRDPRKYMLPLLPAPLTERLWEGSLRQVTSHATLNRVLGRGLEAAGDLLLPWLWRTESRSVSAYLDIWQRFYALVCEMQGTSVFVDGSKSARKVALVTKHLDDGPQIKIIHLVRDPRGFVASARRRRADGDVRTFAWLWRDLHGRFETLSSIVPSMRIRYEDLAARPHDEIRAVLAFLGESEEPVVGRSPFPEKHHVIGSTMLASFTGHIALEERWREELTLDEQQMVLWSAGDLAMRYGYGHRSATGRPKDMATSGGSR